MSLHTKFYSLALLFIFAAGALAVEETPAPLSPEEAVQEMRVPEGFAATLVAAEPNVVQPISFCFDGRGRLFVAEALNYGEWQPTGKDRIVILEDTDARPVRYPQGVLRRAQLRNRAGGRLRRRLGHVTSQALLHSRPGRRRQTRRRAANPLR